MGFGFGYNFGDFIKGAKHGGAIKPMAMPTGLPIISRDLRGIPVAIPRLDRVDNTFKDGGGVYPTVSYFVDQTRKFLSGSVVQSRIPMLSPRPMIFNVRM